MSFIFQWRPAWYNRKNMKLSEWVEFITVLIINCLTLSKLDYLSLGFYIYNIKKIAWVQKASYFSAHEPELSLSLWHMAITSH